MAITADGVGRVSARAPPEGVMSQALAAASIALSMGASRFIDAIARISGRGSRGPRTRLQRDLGSLRLPGRPADAPAPASHRHVLWPGCGLRVALHRARDPRG